MQNYQEVGPEVSLNPSLSNASDGCCLEARCRRLKFFRRRGRSGGSNAHAGDCTECAGQTEPGVRYAERRSTFISPGPTKPFECAPHGEGGMTSGRFRRYTSVESPAKVETRMNRPCEPRGATDRPEAAAPRSG